MRDMDWWDKLHMPSEISPRGTDSEEGYGWHFFECDNCGDILGFQQYPNDGNQLCIVCGLKKGGLIKKSDRDES